MLSNPGAVVTARGGRVTMKLKLRPGSPKTGVAEVIRQGFSVQEFLDGSKYEGNFVNGLKHGEGRYTWKNGEFYEGSFYKDYRHGDGMYCWPSGNKFIGKFYLNWREGYGVHIFPDGATFKGLYHADQRFGPGVLSESNGCQDVGLWHGKHLIQLCTSVQGSFSLKNFTEYAAYLEKAIFSHSQRQVDTDESWLPNDTNNAFPCGMENYSADGDHLPFPPDRKREFDKHFYGQLGEPDSHVYKGHREQSHNSLPLQVRILAHVHKHSQQAEKLDWDVDAVLSLKRDRFGPKGQLEVTSELLIQQASIGKGPAILKILLDGLVHPDVADSQGHTALIAATVNCHNDVIQLLLDLGADIDKVNCEGMSALSVCHVLYYPFQSLYTFAGLTCTTQAKETKVYTEGDEEKADSKMTSPTMSHQIRQAEPSKGSSCSKRIKGKARNRREDGKLEGGDKTREFYEAEGRDDSGTEDKVLLSERSVEVKEGHIVLGSVKWKEYLSKPAKQDTNKNVNAGHAFDSGCCMYNYNIHVTESLLQEAADALSHAWFQQNSGDTEETVRKMAAMKFEHRVRLTTLNLLLDRGADPNTSRIPLPVIFLAILAADTNTVRKHLLCGARTDISLPPKRKGLYPLHVAAALPGLEGPEITKLLLHALTDPDARACDQDDIYEPDKGPTITAKSWRIRNKPLPKEGGRTALHIACQRDSDYCNASKVVSLLLSYKASTDFLWSGHSPLSLAIASGNNTAVEELLKGGGDPNLPLGRGVGSALCALGNFNYRLDANRPRLLDMLEKVGADILMPVQVGDSIGTAVDYAHVSFDQDSGIAHTPYHALSMAGRETFRIQRLLLSMMGSLLKKTVAQREREHLEREECRVQSGAISPSAVKRRSPFRFCYHCGRSAAVKLTACTRCHKVFYCSMACKLIAWDERHKEECLREAGSVPVNFEKRFMIQTKKGPKTIIFSSRRPFNVQFKSQVMVLDDNNPDWQDINLKENYSYN
ncbi:ankyrin repeat and MYND domain-containing protein 1-like isoform X12 [Corythoichthys intestinalis]|uniref:ankyrin repeat and MYND domain-containing protein 1-like isoform X12 n=1 Tax=Corythoichthys intestinalis TaxID=161448 RepID=UPI0025A68BAC|nr:ankyrin repeat and MYND domain-containing protein 1-like isoform X12 [Corythoichthys intestinalis]